jgi:hypothetical protein
VKDFAGDVIAADRVAPAMQEGSAIGYGYGGAIGGASGAGIGPGSAGGIIVTRANPMLLPGQLGGVILDPSGAAIGGAAISITNPGSGFNTSTRTDGDGRWAVSNLASGNYRIRAESPGFNPTVRNVIYNANRPGSFDLSLNEGTAMETVEVQAESVDSSSMNGRKAGDLAQRKPGIAQPGAASANVVNLQRRIAGVLPVTIDIPHAGTSFKFVRPLVLNEETKVTFSYKNK